MPIDPIFQGMKAITVKANKIRPGVMRLTFKSFEDMGQYFEDRLDEFEAKGARIVTVGIVMFIFEAPAKVTTS